MNWANRDPFVAKNNYPSAFKTGWGVSPVCHICGGSIVDDETIRWQKPGRPDSIVHHACEESKAVRISA